MTETRAAIAEKFAGLNVLVIGDIMLDRFVYGRVERISPEAPIPVIAVERESAMLGGAGNVARNAVALGARVSLVAAVGDDEAGRELVRLLEGEGGIVSNLVTVAGRPTTVKTRYIAGSQQLLRADAEVTATLDARATSRLLAMIEGEMADASVVLVSDYAKGMLSTEVLSGIAALAKRSGKKIIADPKSRDFARYAGAHLVTPNARELSAASGMPAGTDDEVVAAARTILSAAPMDAILVTRSERGMTMVPRDGAPFHVRPEARDVFDVSGAGDTALAALGLSIAAGASLNDAAMLANLAAGIAVGKAGTAIVRRSELIDRILTERLHRAEEKMLSAESMMERVAAWRARGAKIVFTNGCFDILHPGHVGLLAEARAQGDRLVVGLNSDDSVRRLKGPERPVNSELSRAVVLASLESVDAVVVFDTDTPLSLITALKPDVLVKGKDYTIDKVVGAAEMMSWGGRVHLADIREGHSTTGTIKRMQR
ncbi:MAG TPA: D-glycero-beta-D-manno-heptose-7-phosphate kinase [Micropepsaceae bacterium]|nr:D-glycero-beta-D-manno-heptose-7-phosphate kinase [Micropepsaceae bacterium]